MAQRLEQAAPAAVALVVRGTKMELLVRPIPVAVAVVAVVIHPQHSMTVLLAHPAAPASSSLSTTSALPQSSPSSHRRSGLHQRVR
jgi:hypothetical protein